MSGGVCVPSYRVPSMAEIEAIPWNGYNVVSTFSGAGGSCLGYRMAGYRVVWANEFIPAAQEVYRANHPGTYLNTKDIREVTADEIREQSGLAEIDLFDGSPPCAAFSTNGLREAYWGREKRYSDSSQVVDDLFFEYTRLLGELRPRTFVAENVSGLVKGKSKGYFKRIIAEMRSCGYLVSARLLDASMLGVPQRRERLIFVGVREDLCERYGVKPVHPLPEGPIYTVRDAFDGVDSSQEELEYFSALGPMEREVLESIPKGMRRVVRGDYVKGQGKWFNLSRLSWDRPSGTILQGSRMVGHPDIDRYITISECKRITSVPDDFVLTGTMAQQWERLGRMVPPVMMSRVAATVRDEILDKCR